MLFAGLILRNNLQRRLKGRKQVPLDELWKILDKPSDFSFRGISVRR